VPIQYRGRIEASNAAVPPSPNTSITFGLQLGHCQSCPSFVTSRPATAWRSSSSAPTRRYVRNVALWLSRRTASRAGRTA